MQLIIKVILIILLSFVAFAKECSPYFAPEKFYEASEFLIELLDDISIEKQAIAFSIKKQELYRYTTTDIAIEINENFGGFWRDWIEDAYEMILVPEYILVKYKNYYLSLNVIIEGVQGDATKLKGTVVNYNFYNYTKQVNQHIACKKGEI